MVSDLNAYEGNAFSAVACARKRAAARSGEIKDLTDGQQLRFGAREFLTTNARRVVRGRQVEREDLGLRTPEV